MKTEPTDPTPTHLILASGLDADLEIAYEDFQERWGFGACGAYAALRREHGWGQVAACFAKVAGAANGTEFGHYVIVDADGAIIDLANPLDEELAYEDVEVLDPDELPDLVGEDTLAWLRERVPRRRIDSQGPEGRRPAATAHHRRGGGTTMAKRTKATEEKAPEAEATDGQIISEQQVASARAAKRESATGTTPSLSSLKIGTKLHRMYHGKRYAGEVVAGPEGAHLLRVKGKGDAKSLSSGASLISGHAERGALVWRTEDGKNLLPGGVAPRYDQMAATPGPKKPASKKPAAKKRSAKATPTHGKVKSSWECGNCHQKFPTQAKLTAHLGRDHKASK